MVSQEFKMKLASSASEQNVFFTYVCLINDIKPNNKSAIEQGRNVSSFLLDGDIDEVAQEHQPIQVERSKALHELIESHKKAESEIIEIDNENVEPEPHYPTTTSGDDTELSEFDECINGFENPNVLKLTKMKWLTEDQPGSPDSSCFSLSPALSTTSTTCSKDSNDENSGVIADKYLSTILRLDKEHNMFGLSNIAIVGAKPSRKRSDVEKAVFHQTAIVQICCGKGCCRHRSNTDLPQSLKCGGCRGCCVDLCQTCMSCGPPCEESPCPPLCTSCPKGKCSCKYICPPSKCSADCTYGMKITLNKKPKYDPLPVELTPRSSCVLQKPFAARSCHHIPQCIPPSSCFPYLMPCFWPARASAPCNTPARCFHNPPCLPARKHQCPIPNPDACVKTGKCDDNKKKCPNQLCPGNNPSFKKEFETRFGKK